MYGWNIIGRGDLSEEKGGDTRIRKGHKIGKSAGVRRLRFAKKKFDAGEEITKGDAPNFRGKMGEKKRRRRIGAEFRVMVHPKKGKGTERKGSQTQTAGTTQGRGPQRSPRLERGEPSKKKKKEVK